MLRRCPTVVMVLLFATMGAWAEEPPAEGEQFAFGMTVSFPGSQILQFRVLSDPLPDLGQGGPVTELKLGPPLDLWVLGMDGNRLDAPEARLVDPDGEVVEPDPSGHWRVNRPEIGYYELTVPPVGQQWRLWSAFHPFMLRLDEPMTVVVGDGPGAVFLHPSGAKLELTDPGEAVIGDDDDATYAAFLPWDLFNPSQPKVDIEGDATLAPGQRLMLRAEAWDPDNDITRIVWELQGGERVEGEELRLEPGEMLEAWTARVTVTDVGGATASAEVVVVPPPLHEAGLDDLIMVQAEDFVEEGGGTVYVTDRGHNVGQMITRWHQDVGHWLDWTVTIGEPGDYVLYARYATASANTRRELTIDGASPGDTFEKIAFPKTGGYGRGADEWRTKRLGPPVSLRAGEHMLRLTNLGDGLALDYIALAPVGEDE
jgi:hypothetical protein